MPDTILKFIIYLLAVYGALTLILSILSTIHARTAAVSAKVRMVLVVKDIEEYIEYIIRKIVKNDFLSKIISSNSLTVIDMKSSDETLKVLKKLEMDYECLDVLTLDEKDKLFRDI